MPRHVIVAVAARLASVTRGNGLQVAAHARAEGENTVVKRYSSWIVPSADDEKEWRVLLDQLR
jgi:hypothetical protein